MADGTVEVTPSADPSLKKIDNEFLTVGANQVYRQRVAIPDGANVTQGATADAAVTGDTAGTISAKLRGLSKIWTDVWDSVNHRIKVDGSGVTQPVSGTVTATGPLTDTQLRASSVPVTGPLTDTQLRASAVPVSGTVTASGPLTDTQLRASAVPVSGPLTDTQLRASAVPVSGTVTVANPTANPETGLAKDATLTGGTARTGLVPVTSGGESIGRVISAATTNATSVKGSAGQVYEIIATNLNAAVRYLKLYNKASAPTVGTDTPVMTIAIPGNTAGAGIVIPITNGAAFGTGIALALTTGVADADTGAVAANEIVAHVLYK